MKKRHGVQTLTSVDELDELSEAKLRDHLLYELDVLAAELRSQEQLSLAAGYMTQAGISKVLNRHQGLPVDKAAELDNKYQLSVPGLTLQALVEAIDRASSAGPATDVFLAAPMSATDKYKADRSKAIRFMNEMRRHKLSVYYAGEDIPTTDDFDAQNLAFALNLSHLKTCRRFVLYLPRTPRGTRPSSIWVELGIALGREIPSTLFVPDLSCVPYIVERSITDAAAHGQHVLVHQHGAKPDEPINHFAKHGPSHLSRS